jgi:uncharacterized coiled-coil protein SlyX
MEDEISLRDLYLMLKRQSRWILTVTVLVTAAVFAVSSLWPPTYESEAVAQALVLNQDGTALEFPAAAYVFRTLPAGPALGVGFSKQIETNGPYVARVIGDATVEVRSRFDDKKNLLSITVAGGDPEETWQFALDLISAFDDYVKDRVFQSAGANLAGALAQSRLKLRSVRSQIDELEASLAKVPQLSTSEDAQTALESDEVPPNVARASNPALAYLGLELAKQQAQLANLNAEIASLEALAADPAQLRRLSEQVAQVNVLSPPAVPEEPVAPRVMLNTALAAVLSLMLAVFLAFLREAIAAEPGLNAAPAPASHAKPDEAAATPK